VDVVLLREKSIEFVLQTASRDVDCDFRGVGGESCLPI
jgi:hypothetical protein